MTTALVNGSKSHDAQSTVFIVDDNLEARNLLQQLLQSVRLNVETFASAHEFLERYDPSQNGCLVLDVRMPGMSGLELQQQLHERNIYLPIIFVSGYAEVNVAVEAMKAGAVDFVQKPFSPQELLDKIQHVLAEDQRRREQWDECTAVAARFNLLTTREREVLKLLVAGKSTKEIAHVIGVSHTTADFHRRHVFEKTGAENAVQLTRLVSNLQLWHYKLPSPSPTDF